MKPAGFVEAPAGDAPVNELATGFGTGLMAKILASLFAAGATLALLTVLLPHSQRANEAGLLAIVATRTVVAGVLCRASSRPLRAALRTCSPGAPPSITGVAYFSAETPSPLIFFYLWIFLYSAYFFDDRITLLQVAYVGVALAALLMRSPPSIGVAAWWLVAMGTLAGWPRSSSARCDDRVESLIERLYDTARTDPLTDLPNRRGFRELLDLELERARRRERSDGRARGDLDHFKEVNDRSGHHVGDAVLARVARLLEQRQADDRRRRPRRRRGVHARPSRHRENEAFMVAERLRVQLDRVRTDAVPRHDQLRHRHLSAARPYRRVAASRRRRSALRRQAPRPRPERDPHPGPATGGPRWASATSRASASLAAMLDLAEAVDLRFSGSARHSETVGRYAEMMASELGCSRSASIRVRLAGVLHDIGKVLIPEAILQKPGGPRPRRSSR